MNSLILNIVSPFLSVQVKQAVKFYEDNKSRLDGHVSKGKGLLRVIRAECSDQHALRSAIAGFNQPIKDQALRELGMRNAATVSKDDFIKNTREAIEVHAKKESTKKELSDFVANLNAIWEEFRTKVPQNPTSPRLLDRAATSVITKKIDTFLQEIDTEVFANKSKS